jgi:hypothetical protein
MDYRYRCHFLFNKQVRRVVVVRFFFIDILIRNLLARFPASDSVPVPLK